MPLIWDNHACIPLRPDSQSIPAQLERYRASGVDVVSLNICWDGVSPDLAEGLLRMLIRSSLTTQEQARVVAQGAGSGRRALVIGGGGKMGRWFAEFLMSQGFAVEVADPAGGSVVSS